MLRRNAKWFIIFKKPTSSTEERKEQPDVGKEQEILDEAPPSVPPSDMGKEQDILDGIPPPVPPADKVLMVEVENVVHEPFKYTEEVKVSLTN